MDTSCAGCMCLPAVRRLPSAAAPPPPQTISLSSLLAKHVQATVLNPSALHDKTPQETVYAIQAAGMQGTLTEWTAPPNKHRVELALGPVRQTDADDGQVAWEQDSTGNVRIVRGDELTASRAALNSRLETFDPLKHGSAEQVFLHPAREPGTGDYILDIALAGGGAQTIYLDPHTYLIHTSGCRQRRHRRNDRHTGVSDRGWSADSCPYGDQLCRAADRRERRTDVGAAAAPGKPCAVRPAPAAVRLRIPLLTDSRFCSHAISGRTW